LEECLKLNLKAKF